LRFHAGDDDVRRAGADPGTGGRTPEPSGDAMKPTLLPAVAALILSFVAGAASAQDIAYRLINDTGLTLVEF
jgi:hypothetical protein